MIKTLIRFTLVGILGARLVPGVITGMVNTAAAMLIARILFTASIGLLPLVVTVAAAEPARAAPGKSERLNSRGVHAPSRPARRHPVLAGARDGITRLAPGWSGLRPPRR